ncbi:MAG: bifunctional phosphopantothenoylcysteine decarboxylase/phosphopantothenate--cysteine ligase CoaBC [Erysipelotrichaceae bacterium]|nr:bifunctional phosphopantothenoylcysteine decarboxylase/phosphopantothenate--cysteine ligase CoaBC [Erysipelotrichaceae bacterium]
MAKQTVVLGVSSSVAAFKSVQLTSDLIKLGYDVEVIMTKNATAFIAPLSFEALTNHNVSVDTFAPAMREVHHIALAQKADVFVLVPATANLIAKVAHGLADDMLTTTFLAADCPKIICPAMNTHMYENPITQKNLEICRSYGMKLVEPNEGRLACGDVGKGKLADLNQIIEAIEDALYSDHYLKGKKVLITAGPTEEAIDPVRFITNHSSGKMGYALAKMAKRAGAEVTLISGPVSLTPPFDVHKIFIHSAKELLKEVQTCYQDQDMILMAAAVADYASVKIADQKIKKRDQKMQLELIKNPDILAWLGEHKENHQILCGFAMETEHLLENAAAKCEKKHCDMLAANHLLTPGAGFQSDTNIMTLITPEGYEELPLMSKDAVAEEILKRLYRISQKSTR